MSAIELRSDYSNAFVSVSNVFIDEYMADANGEFVKVYLYLLRCMNSNGKSVSISDIADFFDHTEKDVMRALKYWAKQGVLSLSFDDAKNLTGLCLHNLTKSTSAQSIGEVAEVVKSEKPTIDVSQIEVAPLVGDLVDTASSTRTRKADKPATKKATAQNKRKSFFILFSPYGFNIYRIMRLII